MFIERAKFYSRVQFVTDLLLSGIAFAFAYLSRYYIADLLPSNINHLFNPLLLPFYDYLWMVGLGILWWAVIAISLGLYRISMRRLGWEKIRIIIESSILLWLFLGILSYALHLNVSRPLMALFVLYQAGMLLSVRLLLAIKVRRGDGGSPNGEHRNIVIIGSNSRAHQMGELIAGYSDWGLNILGYVDLEAQQSVPPKGDILGSMEDLERIVDSHVIDEFIYIGEHARLEGLERVLEISREQGIHIRLAADFFPAKVAKLSMEFLENIPI
ncbi:MAG: hypothetical protein P8Z37_19850, partial [Acidobacteriota bacterium]